MRHGELQRVNFGNTSGNEFGSMDTNANAKYNTVYGQTAFGFHFRNIRLSSDDNHSSTELSHLCALYRKLEGEMWKYYDLFQVFELLLRL